MDKETTKALLKELLKENLAISISESYDYGSKLISVSIDFDGEEICKDFISISTNND